ncbi:MGC53795 protein, related [Eimeria necatrix]|uniref:MGC53795 protein, related n=1 Tax=Eimeria necatrix TaxID=51315 RepID=U6MGC8_9EIME|nr:MGC53795 protein, related [Eimeria necatrix]CDJ62108.1 MGC53795 protein, related [Eimeria necatrix]
MDGSKILVFAETKRGADNLTRDLRMEGWPALSLHGDKKQEERTWVLDEFKQGRNPIMVATDVASRGLDVKDIRHVINYDMPNQIEDYVHRIGRTGRAGAKGQQQQQQQQQQRQQQQGPLLPLLRARRGSGRVCAGGNAYTFFTTDKQRLARDLVRVLKEASQVVPPELEALVGYGGDSGGGRWGSRGGPRGGPRGGGGPYGRPGGPNGMPLGPGRF